MKTIVSGIQPSGPMHLGNYFGAVRNWKELSKDNNPYFFVADLHAMTNDYDPSILRRNVSLMRATLSALEIPHFVQSKIKEHTELQWHLNSIARIGWLNRMTQYKSKYQSDDAETISVGLYTYPVLQAADILLYQDLLDGPTFVPVGQDQLQHIQLVRDIANRANNKLGDTFVLPEPIINNSAPKIMSLYDPLKKMSKSDSDDFTRINFTDDDDYIAKKIKKATSDQYYLPDNTNELAHRPAAMNLVRLLSCANENSMNDELKNLSGKGFGYLKKELTDSLVNLISPIRKKIEEYIEDFPQIYDSTYHVRPTAQYNMFRYNEKFGVEL